MSEKSAKSALSGHRQAGRYGAATAEPGVTLTERRPRAIVQVNGAPEAGKLSARLEPLAVSSLADRKAASGEGVTWLWNGPGKWLVVSTPHSPAVLMQTLKDLLAGTDATLCDLSHARTIVRVTGERAAALLCKGCPLDVEGMRSGDCAVTLLGSLSMQLHCVQTDACFDVYVFRSFGVALWEWMTDASSEFGYAVEEGCVD